MASARDGERRNESLEDKEKDQRKRGDDKTFERETEIFSGTVREFFPQKNSASFFRNFFTVVN